MIRTSCSMSRGSRPTTNSARSSMAPTTALVFQFRLASPQPCRPSWSVRTLTRIQFRSSALTTRVWRAVMRTQGSFSSCGADHGKKPLRLRPTLCLDRLIRVYYHRMDRTALECFVALAEELHFHRAADRCHISQPAMSQQIRRLEGELDVRLAHRTKRAGSL